MVNIQSNIGNSNFTIPQTNKWNVDNESQNLDAQNSSDPNFGKRISTDEVFNRRRIAQEKAQNQEQIFNQDARRRVDLITGLGRKTKEVTIDNTVFVLRTLKSFEQNCLYEVVENAERSVVNDKIIITPTSLSKIKKEALAHSLFMIDGQSIDIILGTSNSDYTEKVSFRKELIDQMDGTLINYLFIKYEELHKEVQDEYFPKNTNEVKEVAEAIYKSS